MSQTKQTRRPWVVAGSTTDKLLRMPLHTPVTFKPAEGDTALALHSRMNMAACRLKAQGKATFRLRRSLDGHSVDAIRIA